jgi:superfamily II DNA/RNA helicase
MPRIGLVLVRGVSGASAATYVHCVGRSGRAGARGTAVALLSPAQAPAYAQLVQTLSLRLADELCSSDFVAAQ